MNGRGAGIGMLVGSVLIVVSTFLTWFTFKAGEFEEPIKGVGNDNGALVMALGSIAFAVVVAILGLVLAIRGRGRVLAIIGVVLAFFPLVVGLYAAFAPEDAIVAFEANQAADNLGISEAEAKAQLEAAFSENGGLEAQAGPGAYLAAAGALIAFGASILGIAKGGAPAAAAVAPPAPGGYAPPPAGGYTTPSTGMPPPPDTPPPPPMGGPPPQ